MKKTHNWLYAVTIAVLYWLITVLSCFIIGLLIGRSVTFEEGTAVFVGLMLLRITQR